MKIFVTSEIIKNTLIGLSERERLNVFKSLADWLNNHKKEGNCLYFYSDLLGEKMFTMWDIPVDKCMAINLDCPVGHHLSIVYYPVIDFEIIETQINTKLNASTT